MAPGTCSGCGTARGTRIAGVPLPATLLDELRNYWHKAIAPRTGCSPVRTGRPLSAATLQRPFRRPPASRRGCGNRRPSTPCGTSLRHPSARSRHRFADTATPARPQSHVRRPSGISTAAKRPPAPTSGPRWNCWRDRLHSARDGATEPSNWRTWCRLPATGLADAKSTHHRATPGVAVTSNAVAQPRWAGMVRTLWRL